ncbi:tetratricopeptide repeat protein [Sorangium sp. So ce1335]|uniref:tetratricopeptide repeat protein n=1 Tax=Sorangium sp. So ce1335 TaxID=3133335 RepID=UPI003F62D4C7
MNARSRALGTAVIALALALAAPARAADVDPATVNAARALAEEGLSHYDKGEYEAALDKLQRADELIQAPTIGLYAARSLERLGRLIEASERYLQVSRMQLDDSASDVFKAAVADAERAYNDLKPRIPKLAVAVRGAPEREVQITIDGKPVPPALVGVSRPVDPGKHVVEGAWAGRVVRREITLPESDESAVTLEFPVAPPKPPVVPRRAGPSPEIAQRVFGWTAVGAGTAGLVVGGITFGVASALRGDLIGLGCTERVECPDTPQTRDKLGSYNRVRLVPAPALIVGGVLAAGGVALLLTVPSASSTSSTSSKSASGGAAAHAWISPWGAGIAGVF